MFSVNCFTQQNTDMCKSFVSLYCSVCQNQLYAFILLFVHLILAAFKFHLQGIPEVEPEVPAAPAVNPAASPAQAPAAPTATQQAGTTPAATTGTGTTGATTGTFISFLCSEITGF